MVSGILIFLVICLLNAALFFAAVSKGADYLYAENGVIENLQVLAIFVCGTLFVKTIFSIKKSHHKLIATGCAWLCLTFILREVDVEDFDIPQIFIFLGSGTGRNLMLLAGWITIFTLFYRQFSAFKGQLSRYFMSYTGRFFMLAAGFLLLGDAFDHRWIDVPFYQFYEELSELNGYFSMVVGALVARYSFEQIERPVEASQQGLVESTI